MRHTTYTRLVQIGDILAAAALTFITISALLAMFIVFG